ncbi:hypothetical protein HLB23_07410 [Nocardia uniformis]|uniref:Uncharacterized protein n=1 Tax=Nocardia uniformis TaxID=53432 RepID=A0A849BU57_9NOCA|nr:hypothetical protein [Nocardia uniformis]NNH69694.1 hypothetical protein [Nocardia uniformis]
MKIAVARHLPRIAIATLAIAAGVGFTGAASAAPVALEPAVPVADSGSAGSGSAGSGSADSSGSGDLVEAGLCTIAGGQWIPILNICIK